MLKHLGPTSGLEADVRNEAVKADIRRWWEEADGLLTEEPRERFVERREVQELREISPHLVEVAVRRAPKLTEVLRVAAISSQGKHAGFEMPGPFNAHGGPAPRCLGTRALRSQSADSAEFGRVDRARHVSRPRRTRLTGI